MKRADGTRRRRVCHAQGRAAGGRRHGARRFPARLGAEASLRSAPRDGGVMTDLDAVCALVGDLQATELERWIDEALGAAGERRAALTCFTRSMSRACGSSSNCGATWPSTTRRCRWCCNLLDQLYALRRRLRQMHDVIATQPAEVRAALFAPARSRQIPARRGLIAAASRPAAPQGRGLCEPGQSRSLDRAEKAALAAAAAYGEDHCVRDCCPLPAPSWPSPAPPRPRTPRRSRSACSAICRRSMPT